MNGSSHGDDIVSVGGTERSQVLKMNGTMRLHNMSLPLMKRLVFTKMA